MLRSWEGRSRHRKQNRPSRVRQRRQALWSRVIRSRPRREPIAWSSRSIETAGSRFGTRKANGWPSDWKNPALGGATRGALHSVFCSGIRVVFRFCTTRSWWTQKPTVRRMADRRDSLSPVPTAQADPESLSGASLAEFVGPTPNESGRTAESAHCPQSAPVVRWPAPGTDRPQCGQQSDQ